MSISKKDILSKKEKVRSEKDQQNRNESFVKIQDITKIDTQVVDFIKNMKITVPREDGNTLEEISVIFSTPEIWSSLRGNQLSTDVTDKKMVGPIIAIMRGAISKDETRYIPDIGKSVIMSRRWSKENQYSTRNLSKYKLNPRYNPQRVLFLTRNPLFVKIEYSLHYYSEYREHSNRIIESLLKLNPIEYIKDKDTGLIIQLEFENDISDESNMDDLASDIRIFEGTINMSAKFQLITKHDRGLIPLIKKQLTTKKVNFSEQVISLS